MPPRIINRGRGPEIEGTRLTVYDIMDYLTIDWHHTAIAAWFRISSAEVQAAIRYIEEHKEEVTARYQAMVERDRQGNPPELQAKLDAISAECAKKWAERRARNGTTEIAHERNPGGH